MTGGERRADWKLARRLAMLASNSPVRGIHRDDACRELGLSWSELWPVAAGPAYGAGMIDVCGAWLVAPSLRKPVPVRPPSLF